MKPKLLNFVAVDLGSSKVACLAAYIEKKGEYKITSQNLHYSKGVRSGVILDLKNAKDSIIESIYALEKDCGKSIKKTTVSLSGAATKSSYVNSKIKLASQAISLQDVKKLIQKALSEFKTNDREIIHYFPVEFTLDHNVIDNPIGMLGKELGCELHIITASSDVLSNIIGCFAKCHVEVSNIVLAIYASGVACLSDDEKKLGSLIIDMGDRTTSMGIFLSGKLVYTNHIDIGSFHISSDIAKVFGVDLLVAEKLKILYGNAVFSSFDKDYVINTEDLIDNYYNPVSTITIQKLSEVIGPRIEEMLSMVKEKYNYAAGQAMAYRVVITGGGSMLRGVKELATKIFDKQVRIAKPEIISGFAEDHNSSVYSTSIGMVKIQSLKQQKEALNIQLEESFGWFKKSLIWLKENI